MPGTCRWILGIFGNMTMEHHSDFQIRGPRIFCYFLVVSRRVVSLRVVSLRVISRRVVSFLVVSRRVVSFLVASILVASILVASFVASCVASCAAAALRTRARKSDEGTQVLFLETASQKLEASSAAPKMPSSSSYGLLEGGGSDALPVL